MSELVGGSTRPGSAPVPYDAQQEPYQRTRVDKERWRKIQHENKLMAGKLREVKREPPANWHSPLTYKSLAGNAKLRAEREGKANAQQPCKEHYVDVTPWPPRSVETASITHSREQRRIDHENAKLFNRLSDMHASRRPRDGVNGVNPGGVYRNEGFQAPDFNAQWAMRTSLYLPAATSTSSPLSAKYEPPGYAIHAPHGSDATLAALARHMPGGGATTSTTVLSTEGAQGGPQQGSSQGTDASSAAQQGGGGVDASEWMGFNSLGAEGRGRPASAGRAGVGSSARGAAAALASGPGRPKSAAARVPKTLGMASCAGCGARGYRKADGVHLEPCPHCTQVWYCSEVCAQVDRPAHEHICKWHQNGHWAPYGKKPVEQHWVASEAMAAASRMLRARGRTAMAAAAGGSPTTLATRRSAAVMDGVFDDVAALNRKVEAARAKERAADARQKAVEDAAYWGLDGPRPCMYMGGKPI